MPKPFEAGELRALEATSNKREAKHETRGSGKKNFPLPLAQAASRSRGGGGGRPDLHSDTKLVRQSASKRTGQIYTALARAIRPLLLLFLLLLMLLLLLLLLTYLPPPAVSPPDWPFIIISHLHLPTRTKLLLTAQPVQNCLPPPAHRAN